MIETLPVYLNELGSVGQLLVLYPSARRQLLLVALKVTSNGQRYLLLRGTF